MRGTVAGSRSTSERRPPERLAALAIAVCLASLALPWYRIPTATRFEKTGLGSFDFAEAALLLTLLSALALIVAARRGRTPPRPLHEGTLLTTAGVWSALLVGYLMVDRPEATVFDFPTDYGLRFGIFVTMGGALTLALAGLRVRRLELRREAAGAPGPTSASRPRSPRSPSRSP
jgi:hypothetical protein